jgi:hypothetical protein
MSGNSLMRTLAKSQSTEEELHQSTSSRLENPETVSKSSMMVQASELLPFLKSRQNISKIDENNEECSFC